MNEDNAFGGDPLDEHDPFDDVSVDMDADGTATVEVEKEQEKNSEETDGFSDDEPSETEDSDEVSLEMASGDSESSDGMEAALATPDQVEDIYKEGAIQNAVNAGETFRESLDEKESDQQPEGLGSLAMYQGRVVNVDEREDVHGNSELIIEAKTWDGTEFSETFPYPDEETPKEEEPIIRLMDYLNVSRSRPEELLTEAVPVRKNDEGSWTIHTPPVFKRGNKHVYEFKRWLYRNDEVEYVGNDKDTPETYRLTYPWRTLIWLNSGMALSIAGYLMLTTGMAAANASLLLLPLSLLMVVGVFALIIGLPLSLIAGLGFGVKTLHRGYRWAFPKSEKDG